VDNKASFVDDLGADSLDIVELVMAFEEAFELRFRTKTPRKSHAEPSLTLKQAKKIVACGG